MGNKQRTDPWLVLVILIIFFLCSGSILLFLFWIGYYIVGPLGPLFIIVYELAIFTLPILPAWYLYKWLTNSVTSEARDVEWGLHGWFFSYLPLCIWATFVLQAENYLIHRLGFWLYLVAAGVALLFGLAISRLKRWHYNYLLRSGK